MTGILAEIIAYKRAFVAESKHRMPQRELERRAADALPVRDFRAALESAPGCALIAEIKSASPSKGVIRPDLDVTEVARTYEESGAAAISVLTDERYFRGSLGRLEEARAATSVPLLRKEFIIDPYQLYEARVFGADAVLLIAACLDDTMLREFLEIAALLNLATLVEVHTEEEMARIASMPVGLIGINNRDLGTFVTDTAVTEKLAPLAPKGALIVSESGIAGASDVALVHRFGARAVLVGEAILREREYAAKVRELATAVPTS